MNKTAKEQRVELLGRVAAMEKVILAADDAEIAAMAAQITQEERQATGGGEAALGQNAKSNANWPLEERVAVAASLAKIAKMMMADDDADADDKPAEIPVAKPEDKK